MTQKPTRRNFLKNASLSLGFIGLQAYVTGYAKSADSSPARAVGYGPLRDDPDGLMRLPKGFSYSAFSKTGERMDDGLYVPAAHDGMAAFPAEDGRVILVRNHEMSPGNNDRGPFKDDPELYRKTRRSMYDKADGEFTCGGGTTTLVFNTKTQSLEQHSLSLAGTVRNCSGGPTPWGSWITCEETVSRADGNLKQDHGYCFEVPATTKIQLADPTPIKGMGRYNHEAIAVDPASGAVYLTEDRHDGLIYRYLPRTLGKMLDGGKLQALAIVDQPSRDTRNWEETGEELFPANTAFSVAWIDMEGIDAPEDDLRFRGHAAGAARFARGEGMHYGNGAIYFACTNGGAKKYGQVFKYTPSPREGQADETIQPGKLELFVESLDSQLMQACDNLTVAPWGDIVICEDDNEHSAIVGITPQGELYHLAHVAIESELAGACFSPDGSTLFVNIQNKPGQTLAITGPWHRRHA